MRGWGRVAGADPWGGALIGVREAGGWRNDLVSLDVDGNPHRDVLLDRPEVSRMSTLRFSKDGTRMLAEARDELLNPELWALAVGAFREASIATGINGDQADNSVGLGGAVYVYERGQRGRGRRRCRHFLFGGRVCVGARRGEHLDAACFGQVLRTWCCFGAIRYEADTIDSQEPGRSQQTCPKAEACPHDPPAKLRPLPQAVAKESGAVGSVGPISTHENMRRAEYRTNHADAGVARFALSSADVPPPLRARPDAGDLTAITLTHAGRELVLAPGQRWECGSYSVQREADYAIELFSRFYFENHGVTPKPTP